ncbi:ribonucleotide-diphosphate reductase subunit beta [Stenotrophomonas sp. GD03657]|uniref:ribonucleotide-diphosphate reductase subunit beta n=1 Tax=Stenotrophomonas sp. GD03657 TaxID=2975363 RepID=UPI00244D3014|nr:ribonucleotide-diphosphate reductase subunit beta [Stenotrophomonas sp. GD03657]MDH2154209.1 ribonucleotide-diphosphate reductase subunit beta [Stenotrophomonas sp. GD03657]
MSEEQTGENSPSLIDGPAADILVDHAADTADRHNLTEFDLGFDTIRMSEVPQTSFDGPMSPVIARESLEDQIRQDYGLPATPTWDEVSEALSKPSPFPPVDIDAQMAEASAELDAESRPFQSYENSDDQVRALMAQTGSANANELLQKILKMTSGFHQREHVRHGLAAAIQEEVAPTPVLDSKIFNTEKTDYGQNESLFLGQDPGLFDTVHRKFPEVFAVYKEQKSLDWSEDEFGFDKAQVAFLTCDPAIVDRMLATLAWQWEGDSTAARSILNVMGPFISNAELQAAWTRITDNEVIHAMTYSEIVRLGIPNADKVFVHVLENAEAMRRLSTVGRVMHAAYERSHQYALGLVPNDQETYNHAMMFTIALLLLERIQFMASFAVTFAIAEIPEAQAFMPIVNAVKRICQDEFEVHVTLDKLVLSHELKTERGKVFLEQKWEEILSIIREVTQSELDWAHWLLVVDDRPLAAADGSKRLTYEDLRDWIYLSAQDVYNQFGFASEFPVPERVNVTSWIGEYLDMSKTQYSPQEQQHGQYKTNLKIRNDAGIIFDVDF